MQNSKPLSNMQLELLQIFSFELDQSQLQEIKSLLAAFFAQKATEEIDKLFENNSWGEEKIQEWSKEHLRTKYKD